MKMIPKRQEQSPTSFDKVFLRCGHMGILPTFKKPEDVLDAINRWHLEKKPKIQFRKIEVLKRLGRRPRNRHKREYWGKRMAWAVTGGVLKWRRPTQKTYSVYNSSDMLLWDVLADDVASAGNTATTWVDSMGPVLPPGVRIRYYKVMEDP